MKLHSANVFRDIKSKTKTEHSGRHHLARTVRAMDRTPEVKRMELARFKKNNMIVLATQPMDMNKFSPEAQEVLELGLQVALAFYDAAPLGIVMNNTSKDVGIITNVSYSAKKSKMPSKSSDITFKLPDEEGYVNVYFHFSVALGNNYHTTWRTNGVQMLPANEAFLALISQNPWSV